LNVKAKDGDDREKWVRNLEDTIARSTHQYRGYCETSQSLNSATSGKNNYLVAFDKKVSEADTYLQMIIDQATKVEQRINSIEDEEEREKFMSIKEQTDTMLDNIKHSIVLLQIAKVRSLQFFPKL
jgi:oxysterol-binding protein-related protein 9/10/11